MELINKLTALLLRSRFCPNERYVMKVNEIVSKTEIKKGWSNDKKYRAIAQDGNIYLLRTSDISQLDRKRQEHEYMSVCAEMGLFICKPISFEICGNEVCTIQSWIEGEDAEAVISGLALKEQYRFGVVAGKILQKIHSIPAPKNTPEWSARFNAKADRKIKMYNDCPIKYDNGDAFIEYVNSHRKLLENRPFSFQHGDYHIGNMMIGNDRELYVIDFNRFDFGDPWEEFNRIVWSAQASPHFASGMVDGYFDNDVPYRFWELLALYISCNTLSSIPWAIPFGDKEIETMKNQAKEVLHWYNGMQNVIPSWYINK